MLLEFSCGAVLVDTGGERNGFFNSDDALRAYLDGFFDRRRDLNRTIDLLVLTHPHKDHTVNARAVVEGFTVKNVVTDGRTSGSGVAQQMWLQDWAREHAHLEVVRSATVPPGGCTDQYIDPLRCADEDPRVVALWGGVDEPPSGWTQDAYQDENCYGIRLFRGQPPWPHPARLLFARHLRTGQSRPRNGNSPLALLGRPMERYCSEVQQRVSG